MEFLRVAGVGIAGILLTSCSGEPGLTTGTAIPETGVTTAALSSDEQAITELLQQEAAALNEWDLDQIVELTCEKYREDARAVMELMTDFATLPVAEFLDSERSPGEAPEIAAAFREAFPSASEASINRAVDAVVGPDDAAVQEAMGQLLGETTTATIDKIENITITGDTATADLTMTVEAFGEPPETQTDQIPFVREDGVWKDCEDPNS